MANKNLTLKFGARNCLRQEDLPRLIFAAGSRGRGKKREEWVVILRPRETQTVIYRMKPDGTFWRSWNSAQHDGLTWPTEQVDCATQQEQIKSLLLHLPPESESPSTLRGQWRGKLTIEGEDTLRVVLQRKISSYLEVALHASTDAPGWAGAISRKPTKASAWYVQEGQPKLLDRKPFLLDVFHLVRDEAFDIAAGVCPTRDLHRRQAFDPVYASKRPVRRAPAKRNHLASLMGRLAASTCKPLDADATPAAPKGRGYAPAVEAVQVEAKALQHATPTPPQEELSSILQAAQRLPDGDHWAKLLRRYAEGRLPPLRRELGLADFQALLATEWEKRAAPGAPPSKAWSEVVDRFVSLQQTAPYLLERTRKLLRFAEAAIASPSCTGSTKKVAQRQLNEAKAVYETALDAMTRGQEAEAMAASRKAAEEIALAAAKLAKACKRPAAPAAPSKRKAAASSRSRSSKSSTPARTRRSRSAAPSSPPNRAAKDLAANLQGRIRHLLPGWRVVARPGGSKSQHVDLSVHGVPASTAAAKLDAAPVFIKLRVQAPEGQVWSPGAPAPERLEVVRTDQRGAPSFTYTVASAGSVENRIYDYFATHQQALQDARAAAKKKPSTPSRRTSKPKTSRASRASKDQRIAGLFAAALGEMREQLQGAG